MFSVLPFSSTPFSAQEFNTSVTLDSVTSTASVNTVTLSTDCNFSVSGVSATTELGDISLAIAIFVDGLEAVLSLSDAVVVSANSNLSLDSVLGTFNLGTISVTTTKFNYEAIKENYSRDRIVVIKEDKTSISRTVYVKTEQPRIVYIEDEPQTRTAYVKAA